MTVAAALEAGQATARAMMTDTCTVRRAGTGEPVYNAADDSWTVPDPEVIYTGPCRVKTRKSMARSADVGADVVVVARRELHLPIGEDGAADVRPDDIVHIDTALNAALTGRDYRVADLGEDQSHGTAHRYGVEQS